MVAIPAVSIVICVYNGASCVARALDSAFTQDFGEAEVIVVDDGSTDRTPEILRGYGARIRVLRQKNRGLAASRNAAVSVARAEYIAFLDADDLWLPGRLAKTVAALDRQPGAVLAFSDAELVDSMDKPVGHRFVQRDQAHAPSIDEMLEGWWPILPSTVTMRRRAFEPCGGFREEYRSASGFEDTFLFMMAREQGPFEYVPEPLIRYRVAPFVERMSKYAPGFRRFARGVRARYGAAGDRLVRQSVELWSRMLVYRGLEALARGDGRQGRRALFCALRYQPSPRNFRRLLRTYLPQRLAIALTDRRRLAKAQSGDATTRRLLLSTY